MIRRSLIIAACVRRMTASTNRKKRRKISARHREVVKNVTEDFLSFQSTPDPNKRKIGRGKKKKRVNKRGALAVLGDRRQMNHLNYTHTTSTPFFSSTQNLPQKKCVWRYIVTQWSRIPQIILYSMRICPALFCSIPHL